ncbi:IS3 family transposase [Undibacterium amnicola]|uniref:IS3 family transposase n=2 Tax=Undibacterium TaxID=401469 RepID=A0ABR6XL43_9BURK|nr:IS3 family transposase [Undibacterium amnicola]MBC3830116.1 IS3 family transposase [Undibacterium amnicola]
MKSTERRSQRDYTLAFKLSVVDQVEKGDLTYKQAQTRYGIQGRSTVLVWLRKHGTQDWHNRGLRKNLNLAMSQEPLPLTPEQRIKELEKQLKIANEKAQLFEAIVNVIRDDFGIVIPKKAFRQVLEHKKTPQISINKACHYFGWTRQAYYQQIARDQGRRDAHEQVIEWVTKIRLRQAKIGTRKLHYLLREKQQQAGIKLGRDALFHLLRMRHLLIKPKRAYHKTTHSHHRFYKHPNLLKAGSGQVQACRPEQVWVADITYIPTTEKFVYLSLVTDIYSKKIVGHHVHASLQTEEVSVAYRRALRHKSSVSDLIHHSDRGIQYCSAYYQQLHEKFKVRCSMTDGYDCYQNAVAERVNGILKGEFLLQTPSNLAQARKLIAQSIQIYNNERPHSSLKNKTPNEVHRACLQHF